jgi:TPP-dependent pyruvate/acetoin dehydrogenase alpha subunit
MVSLRELDESLVNKIIHGSIKTHCNLCSGQGAFLAAFIAQLDKSDVIFDSHRSHGHNIAKGNDNKRPCWRSTDVKTVLVVAGGSNAPQ